MVGLRLRNGGLAGAAGLARSDHLKSQDSVASMLVNIFGASPVQPLEKHIDLGHRAAGELPAFFDAVMSGNWAEAEQVVASIRKLEREAETLKRDIRLHLPKSLFMPVPRQDILELLLVQDQIPDLALKVASTVLIRHMTIPDGIVENFREFVLRVVDTTAQARKSVRELDELFESGFRGAEAQLVESMIDEIDRIEAETDAKRAAIMTDLLAIEDTLPPIHAVFLYSIIDQTAEIADTAERVGRRLEVLLAH